MADYELNSAGQYINYMNGAGPTTDPFGLFKFGGIGADGKSYPKVDMSLWDQATMCATCHVGGVFYEQDRMGNRLPARMFMDWAGAMLGMGNPTVNPITTTVWEKYDVKGGDASIVTYSPWAFPVFQNNNPSLPAVIAPNGWAPADMVMQDPNTGAAVNVKQKQLMMPNVKEMDCLFCHMEGYDNVSTSVMVQAGNLAFAPAAGAGLMDMMPISPSYMGYDGRKIQIKTDVAGWTGYPVAVLNDALTGAIKGKPADNNCLQCHATKRMKDFPEMFGVTANGMSAGFLSSAPMIYDPAHAVGPLGKRMTAFDINSPFLPTSMSSTVIDGSNIMSNLMPGLPSYPSAMGSTPFNNISLAAYQIGGGNMGQTGPIYYYNDGDNPMGDPNQRTLKVSTAVFARAEWFKRGDSWRSGDDVHAALGCAACHFTDPGKDPAAHKSQCDPGRGFDTMSGIQDSVPPLKDRNLITADQGDGNGNVLQTPRLHDTRNTVKRCEFCHVTGKNFFGESIDTFGAPNADGAHRKYGLTANINQIVTNIVTTGAFGGQGIAQTTDFTTPGQTTLGIGNHLDVMDCTVCHVQKKSMAVRLLDATSGMRFPVVVGTNPQLGMMGLFEDPAPASMNEGARQQYNQMYAGINMMFGYVGGEPMGTPGAVGSMMAGQPGPGYQNLIPYGTQLVGGPMVEWKPLNVWSKIGNMELPISFGYVGNIPSSLQDQQGSTFRRKIYLANPIVAALWNNISSTVDANGDGAVGGLLNNSKPSLDGYVDIFTGNPLDKNNTQGYNEPIFDPWIMRDLKVGFNFGPAPLSVISIGFGGFGTPAGITDPTGGAYQAIMMGDGTFTGQFKYASVWSGATTLTEPGEIHSYIQYRNAIKSKTDGKSWDGTQMTLVGDPFTITHGVKSVTNYVKGKNCADCHAPGAGFFNGDFTMTGTAIPASRSYNPTAQLVTDANYNLVLDANGDPIRMPGLPGFESMSNMMQRPLEPFRVKALKGELRTGYEGFNKLGQPRTTEFQKEVNVAGVDYDYTVPLQRSSVLYPEEKNALGQELKIYYKAGDVNPATGVVKAGAVAMSGQEYADYLETLSNAAAFGIGIAPVAVINPITDIDPTRPGTQVAAGTALTLSAQNAQPAGNSSYLWYYTDGTKDVNGNLIRTTIGTSQTVTANFTAGSKVITLEIIDEEGKFATAMTTVEAVAPGIGIAVADGTANVNVVESFNFTNLPTPNNSVKISWGDGMTQTFTGANVASLTKTHKYTSTGSKKITVNVYVNGIDPATGSSIQTLQGSSYKNITVQ